jgi:Xaa-Pro aminopeptidase
LDLSFLEKPHEHDPRRVLSTTGTDWQLRVDFDRLRGDRLRRARAMMERHDLGALVCFVGENVRYITSVFQGNWKNSIFVRYWVLPRGGDPVLFETAGSDLECAKIDAPWLKGNIRPAITWKWSMTAKEMMADRMACSVHEVLKENGVDNERIGVTSMTRRRWRPFRSWGSTRSVPGRRCLMRGSSRPLTSLSC